MISATDYDRAVEVAPNVWWVGFFDRTANFHCNPYLIECGDEAVLIDPGSIPHFPIVARKVSSVIKFSQIRYIVIHHQDPDLASNIAVFEKLINRDDLEIVTSERAALFTTYYGYKSPHRMIEEGSLKLGDVRFEFIATPHLHAPGAFVSYDKANKILFSSDIFGAFSDKWDLYAKKDYGQQMEAFHQFYMPVTGLIRKQMDEFRKLDIELIAPQHGSVIGEGLIRNNIDSLSNMKVDG